MFYSITQDLFERYHDMLQRYKRKIPLKLARKIWGVKKQYVKEMLMKSKLS
jgi:hypothetical protein